jgi:hypothetical protein
MTATAALVAALISPSSMNWLQTTKFETKRKFKENFNELRCFSIATEAGFAQQAVECLIIQKAQTVNEFAVQSSCIDVDSILKKIQLKF